MKKRKYIVLLLLPLLMLSFLSVGYSQVVSDNSIISMSGKDWSLKVDSTLASSIDSRNTPYMTAKSSTEKELFLELATLEDCKSGVVQFKVDMAGLTAYKQLPLTEQEIAEGSFRPKNVENSFALFDDSGRKVAHIYGSKITDSKGVEIWLDQDLAGGLLTVYLPKLDVLEILSFPLLLDPTFGFTSVGASTDVTPVGYLITDKFTMNSEAGDLIDLRLYTVDAGNHVKFAVYSDNASSPDALLSESGEVNTVANDWVVGTMNASALVADAVYYLGFKLDAETSTKYDTVPNIRYYVSNAYAVAFPDPFGSATNDDKKHSIYATYDLSATPTPTPFASATPFPEGAMDDTDWWISILVLLLIIINIFLMMLPFALVRFTFGILSLFLCMLALSYQIPLSPYLQTAGLLISALAMLFSVRARE